MLIEECPEIVEWPKVLHTFANMSHIVMVQLNDTRTIKLHQKISISVDRVGHDRRTGMSSVQYLRMRQSAKSISESIRHLCMRIRRAEQSLRKLWELLGWIENLSLLLPVLMRSSSVFPCCWSWGAGSAWCTPLGRPSAICDVALHLAASRVERKSTDIQWVILSTYPLLSLFHLLLCSNPRFLYLPLSCDPKLFHL